MSSRKTKREKIRLSQRKMRDIEIKKLEKDILELEEQIKKEKKHNLKRKCIRNLKIFGSTCNFLAPFVLVSGLSVVFFKSVDGGYPFVLDDEYKYKNSSLEYQIDGTIEIEEKYTINESDESNILKVYSPWVLNEDGFYTRIIREYSIEDLTNKSLFDAVLRKDFDYIEEKFSDYKEEQEISNNVDYQYEGNLIEAKLYSFDKSYSLVSKESIGNNIWVTILVSAITILGGILFDKVRCFDVKYSIRNINDNYNSERYPIEFLESELQLKKQKVLSLNKGGKTNVK